MLSGFDLFKVKQFRLAQYKDIHLKTQILNYLVYLYSRPIRLLVQEMK